MGVSWHKKDRKWIARIRHDGKQQRLGCFDDEREAARAFDTEARRLRGDGAHGGRAGGTGKIWHRLNFPTEAEVKRAQERGALLTEEDKAAAARRTRGEDTHGGQAGNKNWQRLNFPSKREAARAIDTAARRLRGKDAHGGRTVSAHLQDGQGVDGEVESSEGEDCERIVKRRKTCVATSEFVGVAWIKRDRKWMARISHDGNQQYLGSFDDEREAARAVDTVAQQLRGDDGG